MTPANPTSALAGALTHDQLRGLARAICAGLDPAASPRAVWQSPYPLYGLRACWGHSAPVQIAADVSDPYNTSLLYEGIDPAHPAAASARWLWVSCTGTHAAVCPRKGRGPSWQVYLYRADGDRPHGTYYASILADMGVDLTEGTLCDAAIRELTGRAA